MTGNDSDNDLQQTQVRLIATKNIVCAYVSNNKVAATDLPKLISDVAGAFAVTKVGLRDKRAFNNAKLSEKPAVPKSRSLSDTELICLECGKSFTSLKRHLMAAHGLTPHEYRSRWQLPSDYPMVTPAYSITRSRLAKDNELGTSRGKRRQPQR